MEQAASKFQKKIDSQARIISRLTAENLAACDKLKLKNLDGQTTSPGVATTSSNIIAGPKKQKGNKAKLKGFVSTQFVNDTGLYSDEDMPVDVTVDGVKPDSTQSAKVSVNSNDDEGSPIIPSTQMVANKKRQRLDSGASVKSRIAMPSSPLEGYDNEDAMDMLRQEKDAVKREVG